jgi:hypothetical protein
MFFSGSRTLNRMGGGGRAIINSMSLAEKAFSEPSAEMPKDSRSL